MADNLLDTLIAHYLRGGKDTPSLRGQLHETLPDNAASGATTPLPHKLGVSFVPLLTSSGARATSVAAPSAIDWAQNITYILGRINPSDQHEIVTRYGNFKSTLTNPRSIIPGMFYSFRYQAATTAYDQFPLVLILDKTVDGLLGMNFHYLPMKIRFALFESMMPLVVPLPVSQLSLIRLTYNRLMKRRLIGRFPTIKRYVFSRIKSQVVFISPIEWAVALAYPSERFIGTTTTEVWANSRKQLLNR